jgi:hypothetical protein
MVNNTPANTAQSMLASKNLTILEDQLNYEALSTKKLNLYSSYCSDPNLKNVCERAEQMHRKHFDILYDYLNTHNKPQQ